MTAVTSSPRHLNKSEVSETIGPEPTRSPSHRSWKCTVCGYAFIEGNNLGIGEPVTFDSEVRNEYMRFCGIFSVSKKILWYIQCLFLLKYLFCIGNMEHTVNHKGNM